MAKWIEGDFPFARLSQVAEHESWRKEVYRPVYYIHKWWARRLGSVFRGILLGACLDEDQDFWQHFYGPNDYNTTTVFDPFMGSGVTIGEAIKLGSRAIGRDINPVAVTACQAAFARYDPLVVHAAFQSLEQAVAPKLRSYFDSRTLMGESASVLYYFIVKTITCPSCAQTIDLFRSRIFSTNAMPNKDPSARAACPVCGAITHTRFDATAATCTECHHVYNPQVGNARGAQVHCPYCQESFKLVERMKDLSGPLPYRRYAKLMLLADGRKLYEPLNEFDHILEQTIAERCNSVIHALPYVRVPAGYNTNQMIRHNYRYWHELFSDRQIICIAELAFAIRGLRDADIQRLFALLFSGALEFNNLFTSFKGEGTGAVRHMFAHHIFKPELMPIEANVWGVSKSSGSFSTLYRSRLQRALDYKQNPSEVTLDGQGKTSRINRPLMATIVNSHQAFCSIPGSVYISQGDSSCTDIPESSIDVVVTDPPFFDNVHYSQLADFFYYWLNQILPLSTNQTTRHPAEVQDTHASHFTSKLTSVFAECRRVLKDDGLFIFSYHHARHEGWISVHRALRDADFLCVQAYPIKAEMSVSMPLHQAKSPIHLDLILVCRKTAAIDNHAQYNEGKPATALQIAKRQAAQLRGAGIHLSLGDAKVILMGQHLCEAHRLHSLSAEEEYLTRVERTIDQHVADLLTTKGEVLYKTAEAQQLALFEELALSQQVTAPA